MFLKSVEESAFAIAKILLQSGLIMEDDLITTIKNISNGQIKIGANNGEVKEICEETGQEEVLN